MSQNRGKVNMNLTEEQKTLGRRNFLKVVAGAPALVALGVAALTRGPIRGGPVKFALIGTGDMGRGHLRQYQKEFLDLKALCDINPKRRAAAADFMVKQGWPKPHEYDDWQEMLQKEDLEAVQIATTEAPATGIPDSLSRTSTSMASCS